MGKLKSYTLKSRTVEIKVPPFVKISSKYKPNPEEETKKRESSKKEKLPEQHRYIENQTSSSDSFYNTDDELTNWFRMNINTTY